MDYIVTSERAMAEYWVKKARRPLHSYKILTSVGELEDLQLGPHDWVEYNVPVSDELIKAMNDAHARRRTDG